MINARKSLSDILRAGAREHLSSAWGSTKPAEDFGVLPRGEYVTRIVAGELFTSKTKGTPGYKLTFSVLEGAHEGRQVWHDIWLTDAALPLAKRDLAKLGVTALEQLENPLPQGIICRARLALWTDDDGTQRNQVKSFTVLRIESPEPNPFAPGDASNVAIEDELANGGASDDTSNNQATLDAEPEGGVA